MWALRVVLCLSIGALSAPVLLGQPRPGGGNEPLPDGARMRLGTGALAVGGIGPIAGTLSPDGKYMALATHGRLVLFERATGKRIDRIGDDGPSGDYPQFVFSPEGKVLAYAGLRGIALVAVPSCKLLRRLDLPADIDAPRFRAKGLSFSHDGKVVAAGIAVSGRLKSYGLLWDVATGKPLRSVEAAQNYGCWTTLSPDGKLLATWGQHVVMPNGGDAGPGRIVQLWDVASGKEVHQFEIDGPSVGVFVHAVRFSPGGKILAVAGTKSLQLFDPESGKELRQCAGYHPHVAVLQFSPDGKELVAGNYTGPAAIQAWDTDTGKPRESAAGPKGGRVQAVAVLAQGKTVALSLVGKTVACWDAVTGDAAAPFAGHQAAVIALAYSPDGKTLASAAADGTVVRWDAASGKLLRTLMLAEAEALWYMGGPGPGFGTLTLSPDARFAATDVVHTSNTLLLWDLAAERIVRRLDTVVQARSTGVAFTRGADRMATVAATKEIRIWDLTGGEVLPKLAFGAPADRIPIQAPSIVIWSPDGKQLAVRGSFPLTPGPDGNHTMVLDVAGGKEVFSLPAEADFITRGFPNGPQVIQSMAFSPDSRLLAAPGRNRDLILTRTDSGKEHQRLEIPGGFGAITAVAFSPDGRTVAVAHGGERSVGVPREGPGTIDSELELWELERGRLRAVYKGQQGIVHCLAFSPDGLTLASGGGSATVVLWDVGAVSEKSLILTAAEVDLEFSRLAKPDKPAAVRAQRRLIASPTEAVAFLKKHLGPAQAADTRLLARWLAELDSENFDTREQACRSLEKLGVAAEPALRKACMGSISLEARRRIEKLLTALQRGTVTSDELQAMHAVEVLERIATPEARALVEAQAALGRMKR